MQFELESGRVIVIEELAKNDPFAPALVASPKDGQPMDLDEFWEARDLANDFRANGLFSGPLYWDFTPYQYR